MRLYDMKRTQDERKDQQPDISVGERESYPYGLRIDLDPESLDKLGLSASEFKAGNTVKLMAQAEVKVVTQVESEDQESFPRSNVELQITSLGLKNQEDFETAWEEATEG